MEPHKKNEILLEDSYENASLKIKLEETFIKSEINSQETEDCDNDCINVPDTISAQEEICDRIKSNTKSSVEELINDIKIEVDKFILDFCQSKQIDPITNQKEIERKRKIASELNEYLNSTMLKRIKAEIPLGEEMKTDVQDASVAAKTRDKQKNLPRSIVYTTRLDDMKIIQQKLNKIDRQFIWEEILRESKPVYNFLPQKTNLTKTASKRKNLLKLYIVIKSINNKETRKVLEESDEKQEITSANTTSCSQSIKNNRKIIGNRKNVCEKKVKDNQELVLGNKNEICTQYCVNVHDEVIDLTDAITDNNNDAQIDYRQTSLTDTLSKQFQGPKKKFIHEKDMLLENLQTTPMNIQNNINRIDFEKEINKSTISIRSNKVSECRTGKRKTIFVDIARAKSIRKTFCPVVYTTRLNDMLVLQNVVQFLDGKYVLNEILRESKPNIKYLRKQNTKVNSVGKINFKRLKIKLDIVNRKNKGKCKKSLDNLDVTPDNYNLLPTEFLCQVRNTTAYSMLLLDPSNSKSNFLMLNPVTKVLEEVEVCRNIALIIYNKLSKMTERFVTDDRGDVTDFCNRTISSFQNLEEFRKEIDPTKRIIKLSTCCWFRRKMNIEKLWSNTATGIARFVQSIHKCLPEHCKCCCKPQLVSRSFNLKFDSSIEDENKNLQKDKINSLIGRALDYCKPLPVKEKSNIEKPEVARPVLIEMNKGEVIEYSAIDFKGNIDWEMSIYKSSSHLHNHVNRLLGLMGANTKELKYSKNEHDRLICELKTLNVPFTVKNYLKLKETLGDKKSKDITHCKPGLKLVMEVPYIEHTRKNTSVKLLKIKDILNSNPITKGGLVHKNKVERPLPNILLINPEPSTSGLSTNCKPNVTKSYSALNSEPSTSRLSTNYMPILTPFYTILNSEPSTSGLHINGTPTVTPFYTTFNSEPSTSGLHIIGTPTVTPFYTTLNSEPSTSGLSINGGPIATPFYTTLNSEPLKSGLPTNCTPLLTPFYTVLNTDPSTSRLSTNCTQNVTTSNTVLNSDQSTSILSNNVIPNIPTFYTVLNIEASNLTPFYTLLNSEPPTSTLSTNCTPNVTTSYTALNSELFTSRLFKNCTPNVPYTVLNKRLVITCPEFPEIETIVDDVAPEIATRLMEEFKNIDFDIKQGKLVATLKSLEGSTFTDEFQTLAKIVHTTQTKIRDCALYKHMKVHLNIRCEPMMGVLRKTTEIKVPGGPVTQNIGQIGETYTLVPQNHRYDTFTRFHTYEKNLYKNSFESYIKSEEEKCGETKDIVMPVISNVFSLNGSTSTSLKKETAKNDFIDCYSNFALNRRVNKKDVKSVPSGSPLPVYQNYLQIVSEQNQILHLTSKTIVENTIETLVNKNNKTSVGQSDIDLEKLETLIPVNFIIDKNIVNDLIKDLSSNTETRIRHDDNVILKSLLDKKTDLIFDDALRKKC